MDLKEIGKNIKAAREAKGASRNRMSRITRLHPETIVNIEEGLTGYNIFALITYCIALGFDLNVTPKTQQ